MLDSFRAWRSQSILIMFAEVKWVCARRKGVSGSGPDPMKAMLLTVRLGGKAARTRADSMAVMRW